MQDEDSEDRSSYIGARTFSDPAPGLGDWLRSLGRWRFVIVIGGGLIILAFAAWRAAS